MQTTTDFDTAALAALRALVGRDDVAFRDGQLDAVRHLVRDRQRVLVVQRTGWGKSAVYFVATALRRQQGAGPTVIVSPLLALMRDQIAAAERAGIRAVTMNSGNAEEWGDIARALADDSVDVLLVSPERLNNPRFRDEQLPDLTRRCGLLVVDEAHCISDWGHDFRPDYRRIKDLLLALPADVPVLATTATANARVVDDVVDQLGVGGHEVLTVRGGLARASLRLGVMPLAAPEQRLGWLLAHLSDLPGSGIIYALTVSAAEDVARALADAGHVVRSYTGRTDPAEREALEAALRGNEVKALVATSALGMGFDKPDLGFVVHLGAPSSPVAYYQQVGRAGRATERADVLLLPGPEDKDIWAWFASASMPREEQATAVLRALAEAGKPLSTAALEAIVDIRRTRLELLLKVLDVDGAVCRVTGGWSSTGQPWVYDAERYAKVTATRMAEQQHMLDYESTTGCRMAFLQTALDDETAAPCGRCDSCAGIWFSSELPPAAVGLAANASSRSECRSSRGRCGRPGWTGSASRCGASCQPARRPPPGGHSPGSPTWAGASGCARCCAPTSPPRRRCCRPASPSWPGGAGRSGRSGSWPCPPGAIPRSSTRSPAAWPRSAGFPTSEPSSWSTVDRPVRPEATAPSGWPVCGSDSVSVRSCARRSPGSPVPARFSSSTTWSARGGR